MSELPIQLPLLSVSLVVYNSSLDLLAKTLASLQAAADRAQANELSGVSVTVVNNASTDEYSAQLRQLLSRVSQSEAFALELLDLPENVGYGAGHNRALMVADSTCHLVLNPDVELAAGALSVGVARLQADPEVVLLSPRARGGDGEAEFLCKRYPSVLVLLLRAFAPATGQRLFPGKLARYQMSDVCTGEEAVEVPLASGCFMLARTADLQALSGFDERYFLYFEDFDLCLRLAGRGRLLYLPVMEIVHHGGYAGRKGLRHLWLFVTAGLRFFHQHGWRWI